MDVFAFREELVSEYERFSCQLRLKLLYHSSRYYVTNHHVLYPY